MRPFKRAQRVSNEIQKVIAEAIEFDARDPRLRYVTIVRVVTSDDLKHAKVYYRTLGDKDEARRGLEHAKGYLRTVVAKKVRMKFTPELTFEYLDILTTDLL